MKLLKIKLLLAVLVMFLAGGKTCVWAADAPAEESKEFEMVSLVSAPIEKTDAQSKAEFYWNFLDKDKNPGIGRFGYDTSSVIEKSESEQLTENAFELLKNMIKSVPSIQGQLKGAWRDWAVRKAKSFIPFLFSDLKEFLKILQLAKNSDFFERNVYLSLSYLKNVNNYSDELLKFWLMLKIRLRIGDDSSDDRKHLELMAKGCEQTLMKFTENELHPFIGADSKFAENAARKAAIGYLCSNLFQDSTTVNPLLAANKFEELENYFVLYISVNLKTRLFMFGGGSEIYPEQEDSSWMDTRGGLYKKIAEKYLPHQDGDLFKPALFKYSSKSDPWLYKQVYGKLKQVDKLEDANGKKTEDADLIKIHNMVKFNFCAKNLWLVYKWDRFEDVKDLWTALTKQKERYEKLKQDYYGKMFIRKLFTGSDEKDSAVICDVIDGIQKDPQLKEKAFEGQVFELSAVPEREEPMAQPPALAPASASVLVEQINEPKHEILIVAVSNQYFNELRFNHFVYMIEQLGFEVDVCVWDDKALGTDAATYIDEKVRLAEAVILVEAPTGSRLTKPMVPIEPIKQLVSNKDNLFGVWISYGDNISVEFGVYLMGQGLGAEAIMDVFKGHDRELATIPKIDKVKSYIEHMNACPFSVFNDLFGQNNWSFMLANKKLGINILPEPYLLWTKYKTLLDFLSRIKGSSVAFNQNNYNQYPEGSAFYEYSGLREGWSRGKADKTERECLNKYGVMPSVLEEQELNYKKDRGNKSDPIDLCIKKGWYAYAIKLIEEGKPVNDNQILRFVCKDLIKFDSSYELLLNVFKGQRISLTAETKIPEDLDLYNFFYKFPGLFSLLFKGTLIDVGSFKPTLMRAAFDAIIQFNTILRPDIGGEGMRDINQNIYGVLILFVNEKVVVEKAIGYTACVGNLSLTESLCMVAQGPEWFPKWSPNFVVTLDELLINKVASEINKKLKNNQSVLYIGSPLIFAAAFGHLDVVKYLVDTCGANVDYKPEDGWPAVWQAMFGKYWDVVYYLIDTITEKSFGLLGDNKTLLTNMIENGAPVAHIRKLVGKVNVDYLKYAKENAKTALEAAVDNFALQDASLVVKALVDKLKDDPSGIGEIERVKKYMEADIVKFAGNNLAKSSAIKKILQDALPAK